jgi:predicted transcriptional regulator
LNPAPEKVPHSHSNDHGRAPSKDKKSELLAELMHLMSDEKLLLIFKTIFLDRGDTSEILISRLKLSRKQYYSRISSLTRAGLVKRRKGRYFVTAFGKVVYDAQKLLECAVKNHWKLKAIDSIGLTYDGKMPKGERIKIIESLISNQQIRDILLSLDF